MHIEVSLSIVYLVGSNLGVPIHVFGPETHMTAIVGMALGTRSIAKDKPEPPPPMQILGTRNVCNMCVVWVGMGCAY